MPPGEPGSLLHRLVAATRAGLVRFADIHAAIAAGYRPTINRTGLDVHLENGAYGKDGRILDEPAHPDRLGAEVGEPRSGVASRAVSIRTIGSATAGPARNARQTP